MSNRKELVDLIIKDNLTGLTYSMNEDFEKPREKVPEIEESQFFEDWASGKYDGSKEAKEKALEIEQQIFFRDWLSYALETYEHILDFPNSKSKYNFYKKSKYNFYKLEYFVDPYLQFARWIRMVAKEDEVSLSIKGVVGEAKEGIIY